MLTAAAWIALYLALVLAPLVALAATPHAGGAGFLRDFALALGWCGTMMLAIEFLLTARFKRATAPYGIDIIYAFHRHLAIVALVVLLAHAVLLIVAVPGLRDPAALVGGPWSLASGAWALILIGALVGTSVWRRALRLEYHRWRVTHIVLAVVAFGLSAAHGHAVGGAARPLMRTLFSAIVLSVLAVIVHVRVARPWWLRRHPYRVVDRRTERGDAWTLELQPDGHAGLTYEPGQFAWLTIGHRPSAMREHPFSFSSTPTRPGRLAFTIKALGDFTATIKDVPVGTTAYVDGPYGAFSIDRHPADGVVFIAGGIGIAPMMSMLRALADRGHRAPVWLFYAYRCWDRLTFREELEALPDRLPLRLVFVLQEPPVAWTGETGLVTRELLDRHLPADRARFQYFVCGPGAMIDAVEGALHRLGVPLGRVHAEVFDLV